MAEEIINRVANSKLKVFDLEDYFPTESVVIVDISQWLYEGILLREKEFRASLKNTDWSIYQDKLVGLICSTDAIIPSWAMMLVTSYLVDKATFVFQGDEKAVLLAYYQKKINTLDFSVYKDQPVIVKGCARKMVPEELYVSVLEYMMPYANSIMFGEACSAVPIFKKKKQ